MSTLPAGYDLRPATNADAEEVTRLVFTVLTEFGLATDPAATDADLPDLETSYGVPGGSFDVLVDTQVGQIVGTVGLLPRDDQTIELRKMYLRADHRGRGLGRCLLDHALARARRGGFQRVFLETASVLETAIRLYQRAGFQPCETGHLSCRCDQAMVLEFGAGSV